MSSSWTFIIVFAKDCVACTQFKNAWSDVKSKLQAHFGKKLIIDEIHLAQRNLKLIDTKKYPVTLLRYINWYPCMILLPTEQLQLTYKSTMNVHVFNGSVPEDNMKQVVPAKTRKTYIVSNFVTWIQQAMDGGTPFVPPYIPEKKTITTTTTPTIVTPKVVEEPAGPVCSAYKLRNRFPL